jgi:O-antigen ligase
MGELGQWTQNSFIFNTALLLSRYYNDSFVSQIISILCKRLVTIYKTSLISRLFSAENWEERAFDDSLFIRIFPLLAPLGAGIIDFINNIAEQSIFIRSIAAVEKEILIKPFKTISLILFPALFISTALQAMLSSFMPSVLMLRLVILVVTFLMYFVELPFKLLVQNSFVGQPLFRLWNNKNDQTAEANNFISQDKRKINTTHGLLAVVSGVIGVLYYFLPTTTFAKLFGIVILGPAIYLQPGIGVAAIAFMLPFTQTTYIAAVAGLTFISVLLNFRRLELKITGMMIPVALFTILAAVAAVFSVMRSESLNSLQLFIVYFILFYSSSVLFKEKKIFRTSVLLFVVSSLIVALYGIYQYFIKIPTANAWVDISQFPELTRVYSTMENPNVLAEYLVFAIPIVLALLTSSKRNLGKAFYLATLLVLTVCLVMTSSRGGWLGLVLSVVVYAALKEKKLFIVILVIALLSPIFLPSVVGTRVASIGSIEDSSNAFRVSIWIASTRMLRDYWLTGVGLGLSAFSRVYRDYMIAGTPALHAHNLYLQVGIEMGVVGLLLLIWICSAAYSRVKGLLKLEKRHSFILAGIIAALAGHLLHGLFDYVWFSPRIVMIFWMYLGMTSALSSVLDKTDDKIKMVEEGAKWEK